MTGTPETRAHDPLLGKRGAFEGVARRHGRQRNPARRPPRSQHRPPTNPLRHSTQHRVEKCGRSIKGSDTPHSISLSNTFTTRTVLNFRTLSRTEHPRSRWPLTNGLLCAAFTAAQTPRVCRQTQGPAPHEPMLVERLVMRRAAAGVATATLGACGEGWASATSTAFRAKRDATRAGRGSRRWAKEVPRSATSRAAQALAR
jgi:hypothetical protein